MSEIVLASMEWRSGQLCDGERQWNKYLGGIQEKPSIIGLVNALSVVKQS